MSNAIACSFCMILKREIVMVFFGYEQDHEKTQSVSHGADIYQLNHKIQINY